LRFASGVCLSHEGQAKQARQKIQGQSAGYQTKSKKRLILSQHQTQQNAEINSH
jgi:hypothetical protein